MTVSIIASYADLIRILIHKQEISAEGDIRNKFPDSVPR